MNEKFDFIKKALEGVKIVFFDVDGTLSIPRYLNSSGEFVIGFTDDDWVISNIDKKDFYKYCIPVKTKTCIDTLDYLYSNGADAKILTAEYTMGSLRSKTNFILDNFSAYFCEDDIYICPRTEDKLKFMRLYALKYGLKPNEICIIDDVFDLCLKANNLGFKAIHSSYLTGE